MEEKIIIYLQSNSNKMLDVFMQAQSYVASWIGAIFLFAVIVIFVNKKLGFGLGFLCTLGVNYLIKEVVARPRPYVNNPQILNKLTTIGKSFPSGHSVSIIFMVLTILFLFYWLNKNGQFKLFNKIWFKVLIFSCCVIFVILTAISRMYLGQHYLSDIVVGLLIGTIGFSLTWLVMRKKLVKSKK